ncbi:DNA polymerase III subunit gamma/tau [Gammaproteobacteria bacterium]|nr:DNA polymerase III subunit gamma/tau [Gammaproteobacteria bacterium]
MIFAMSYEVLARKYRPTNFNEVVGQEHIVQAISNGISQDRIHQAYIFAGTRGVGKTTLARILAKCLNCQSQEKPTSTPCDNCVNCEEIRIGRHLDFLEVDAASKTGVDDMRDLLETVQYKPSQGRYKIYLIDEVHMLSTSSFNALLKTLEEPPAHIVFIFATTNPDKIPKTVQSRCLQLNLKTVGGPVLSGHLKKIIDLESIPYDEESIELICNSAKGSVRDALTLLDQAIAHGNGELKSVDVKKLLGTIDNSLLISLINSVIDGDGEGAFNHLYKIEELSPEYEAILKSIISILHKTSLEQVLRSSNDSEIKGLATKIDEEFCQLLYEIAVNAYSKFHVHPSAKESLEICLLRMLAFNPLHKIDQSSSKAPAEEKKNLKTENLPESSKEVLKSEVKVVEDTHEPKIPVIAKRIDVKTPLPINTKIINSSESWVSFFDSLDISVFARSYFGYLSFESYEDNILTLVGLNEENKIPDNIFSEFKLACKSTLGDKLDINVEHGQAESSPLGIKDNEEASKQKNAEENIAQDTSIQNFLKKFDGSIKDGSIKPTT